jgi:hydroxymethylpyrimidine kinase/phosphomethylpyrimidine kinase/thiamine-phosphate diphosphorylase
MTRPPVIWSIAGTDSSGGAGLSADQRAADAFGIHLCPVVAAVTAQHSRGVTRIGAVDPALLDAQLEALADDLRPRVVKTGLLGGAAQVRVVARWMDRLREAGPVALVVDPVLAASTGASFADAETLLAYRRELLPRSTVVTPNRHEALALLGEATGMDPARAHDLAALPALAQCLRGLGAAAVCITGGDSADHDGQVLDWLDSEHVAGWLASPRVPTAHDHGTGCTFASSVAAALALGFVPADAAVLAKMATANALQMGHAAGAGAGPVRARPGFAIEPGLLPRLSWDEAPRFAAISAGVERPLGLYAIVESAARVEQVLAAGVRTVQLRIKTPADPDAAWRDRLQAAVTRSVRACRSAGAEFFVNDHWELAYALGAPGVHLGQEDMLALGDAGRQALAASGLKLGISSHSLWELCRARASSPRYIACGPVWPTLTKLMPWQPQGLANLRWWQHMAGAPVAAIGGILSADQVADAASCGVDGVCVVRALGDRPATTVPALLEALAGGSASGRRPELPSFPRPSLAG